MSAPAASSVTPAGSAGAGAAQMTRPADSVDVTTCFLCGGRDSREEFADPPYSVRRCVACGLVWVTPRFTEAGLRQVYGETYWNSASPKTQGYADYRRDEPLYLKTFRRRFGFVRKHTRQSGRVLDVGCAAGFFLRIASEKGWEVHGVELSAEIARFARDRYGFTTIHNGTLDTAPHAERSFDLVTMWDVVEHIPEPRAFLRRARQMLKPGGTLIIETQNVDSSFARMLGRRWHHYKHQEHLYHFNQSTLRRLLVECGFEVAEMTAGYGGKYVSFGFIAERAARLGKVASLLLAPLNLLRSANVYVNLRDELVVAARAI